MIRKSGHRFSIATNAKVRLRGDHAQTISQSASASGLPRHSDGEFSKAEREPDLPQDDERGIRVSTVVKMFVEQRGDHHSHSCIEAPFDHALRVPAIGKG
jgi:hypothetical protein